MGNDIKSDNLKEGNDSEKFILLAECISSGYSPEYLRFAAEQGILEAKRIGGEWYTTKKWLGKFLKKYSATPEKDKMLTEEKKRRTAKIKYFLKAFVLPAAVVFVAVALFRFYLPKDEKETVNADVVAEFSGEQHFFSDEAGKVAAESVELISSASASENFQLKNIRFGGDMVVSGNSEENLTLKVSDVRSETFMTKKQDEVKVVVTWKTNKLALSEVVYSKNGAVENRIAKEESYGFNHGVIIGRLEPSSSYTYQIHAKDRWGNSVDSDRYGVYTGSRAISVFEMISKAAEDVFGWAIKK